MHPPSHSRPINIHRKLHILYMSNQASISGGNSVGRLSRILNNLTLTRPIGLPPHAPVAQKTADQR